ncbi:MAG: hypothetical protein OXT65_03180 [Alphaproteobacteria bacterium]|nr:hypothetical protein [Alphaproteobacteria bacterium]
MDSLTKKFMRAASSLLLGSVLYTGAAATSVKAQEAETPPTTDTTAVADINDSAQEKYLASLGRRIGMTHREADFVASRGDDFMMLYIKDGRDRFAQNIGVDSVDAFELAKIVINFPAVDKKTGETLYSLATAAELESLLDDWGVPDPAPSSPTSRSQRPSPPSPR